MNLQICIPYIPCPFHCPMCIASGRKEYNNLYKADGKGYFEKLKQEYSNYKTFVLTGDTDPTLTINWLNDMLEFLDTNRLQGQTVELQTHNYNLERYNLKGLDVLCYSIVGLKDYLKIPRLKKINGDNRLVILLTKDFDFLNLETFDPHGFNQITFKVLQYGADEKVNEYVDKHKMTDLSNIYQIVNKYNGDKNVSVRLDTNCQDAVGRYEIFRSDGKFYENWETEIPIEKGGR